MIAPLPEPRRAVHVTSRHLVILLSAALFAAGCADAKDPVALVTTAETAPALNLDVQLPTLPGLVAATLGDAQSSLSPARREVLLSALGTWASAEVASDSAAAMAARSRAESQVAGPLAEALGPRALAARIGVLQGWVALGLSTAPAGSSGAALRRALEAARARLADAVTAQRAGDATGAIRALMSAADALEGATPGAVAQRLVERAQRDLAVSDSGAQSSAPDGLRTSRERAMRLLRGAREALGAQEYDLAIRRAFYAAELLGGR